MHSGSEASPRLPQGLRVQRSSSLWAAVGRAIGFGKPGVMASRLQTLFPALDVEEGHPVDSWWWVEKGYIYIYRVLLQYENIWIGFLGEHVLVYSLLKMIMEMHYPWILLPKLGILVRNGWFKIMLVSTRVQKADAAQLRAAPARRTKRNVCGPSWPEPTWLRRFMTATRPRTDRLAVPRCTDWMCIPVSKRM